MRRAILVPLLAAGCAFTFVFALLPRPSSADGFALRVLSRLEQLRISGSVIHLRGATIIARCNELHGRRELISLAHGGRIVVRETHVHLVRRQRLTVSAMQPALFAAEADLAGPRLLYVYELIGREAARSAAVRARCHLPRATVGCRPARRPRRQPCDAPPARGRVPLARPDCARDARHRAPRLLSLVAA